MVTVYLQQARDWELHKRRPQCRLMLTLPWRNLCIAHHSSARIFPANRCKGISWVRTHEDYVYLYIYTIKLVAEVYPPPRLLWGLPTQGIPPPDGATSLLYQWPPDQATPMARPTSKGFLVPPATPWSILSPVQPHMYMCVPCNWQCDSWNCGIHTRKKLFFSIKNWCLPSGKTGIDVQQLGND